jgi:hypothetical protein
MPTPKDDSDKERDRNGGILLPRPDPTVLTTQQLLREMSTSREIVEALITGIRETIETRLGGMDKAISLLQVVNDRLPEKINENVAQLRQLHEEKFRSIAVQFMERDTRTEQTSRDSKVAVDAALQAAKEAVGEQNKSNALAIAKSEATFTKQIDQIGALISTMQKGTDDKIDDIKSRLQTIESTKQGQVEAKKSSYDAGIYVIAVVGAIVGMIGIGIALIALFQKH